MTVFLLVQWIRTEVVSRPVSAEHNIFRRREQVDQILGRTSSFPSQLLVNGFQHLEMTNVSINRLMTSKYSINMEAG